MSKKGQKPSHVAFAVSEGHNGKHWHEFGGVWPTKNGGFSGDAHDGKNKFRLVIQPREELEKMRAERKQQQPVQNQTVRQQQ